MQGSNFPRAGVAFSVIYSGILGRVRQPLGALAKSLKSGVFSASTGKRGDRAQGRYGKLCFNERQINLCKAALMPFPLRSSALSVS